MNNELLLNDSMANEAPSTGGGGTPNLAAVAAVGNDAQTNIIFDDADGNSINSNQILYDVSAANLAFGGGALSLAGGNVNNTVFGISAGAALNSSYGNTLIGKSAGAVAANVGTNTFNITAVGHLAFGNNVGGEIVAIGHQAARYGFSTNIYNTVVGNEACSGANMSGRDNVALGYKAARLLDGASYNTCIGSQSFQNISTSVNCVGVGYNSGANCTSGQGNTCIGYQTGLNISTNSFNTILGTSSNVSSSAITYAVALGVGITASASNAVFFRTNIGVVSGVSMEFNSANGQMGPISSTRHHKENIKDLEVDSSKVFDLQPRTYTRKQNGQVEFGLIAEEVAEVLPELAVIGDLYSCCRPGEEGDNELIDSGVPISVKYQYLSVLLLAELKKMKATMDDMESRLLMLEIA